MFHVVHDFWLYSGIACISTIAFLRYVSHPRRDNDGDYSSRQRDVYSSNPIFCEKVNKHAPNKH